MLSDILSFSFYSNPNSDPHTMSIDLTFSTGLRTQLQNHHSDALIDPESLTKNPYLKYCSSIFSKSLEITQNDVSAN